MATEDSKSPSKKTTTPETLADVDFKAITEGLGLATPKHYAWMDEPRAKLEFDFDKYVTKAMTQTQTQRVDTEKKAPVDSMLARSQIVGPDQIADQAIAPPPLPKKQTVSMLKRFFAALLDQLFVITLWMFSMGITLNILGAGLELETLNTLSFENELVRFAGLQFLTLWLAYFAICYGLLNVTFGMWVTGLRVQYDTQSGLPLLLKRILRVCFGFIFYAPIAPLLLLAFVSKSGRNLLDAISGSKVCQAQ